MLLPKLLLLVLWIHHQQVHSNEVVDDNDEEDGESTRRYKRHYEVGQQGVFVDYDYPSSPLAHLNPLVPVSSFRFIQLIIFFSFHIVFYCGKKALLNKPTKTLGGDQKHLEYRLKLIKFD